MSEQQSARKTTFTTSDHSLKVHGAGDFNLRVDRGCLCALRYSDRPGRIGRRPGMRMLSWW